MSSGGRQRNTSPCPLRELDEVAYLRFASVYRGFESDDLETEIAMLRAESWEMTPYGRHQEDKGVQPECRDSSIGNSAQKTRFPGQQASDLRFCGFGLAKRVPQAARPTTPENWSKYQWTLVLSDVHGPRRRGETR